MHFQDVLAKAEDTSQWHAATARTNVSTDILIITDP